jgi:CRISPR-associated endonuclease Cas1/CRISPR-associated protein Cas4
MEVRMAPNSDPLPARMINEWVYCPRLAMLEHLHGEWADNQFTEDGKRVHRRVDTEMGDWPRPEEIEGVEVARSLWLTSAEEGITTRMDLVEADAKTLHVRPVDYKRSEMPSVPGNAYEPERVQVCAQALVLRSHGYPVTEGAIWYAKSRRRVRVLITDDLVQLTRRAAGELREAMEARIVPPPLVDSPKCNGCSLAPICLPDEVTALQQVDGAAELQGEAETLSRRLIPARDDLLPLHVTTQGARIGVNGHELVVRHKERELGRCSILQTSQVSLYGNVQVSTQALRTLLNEGKPVAFFSRGGWFYGFAGGVPHGNVFLRQAQYRAVDSKEAATAIVRRLVFAKVRNQRTLLRRNSEEQDLALRRLEVAADNAMRAADIDAARGYEGEAAAAYFRAFPAMMKEEAGWATFQLEGRNRRPPTDPINAALSFCYALLLREWVAVLVTVGFDPFLGFLHTPRHGRPALALDLMEELRPVLADSVVIGMFNTGELAEAHFVTRGPSCNLTDVGRKRVLEAWERRMDTLVTHPVFGYRISYRRILEVQARLFGRFLLGELPAYPSFLVR